MYRLSPGGDFSLKRWTPSTNCPALPGMLVRVYAYSQQYSWSFDIVDSIHLLYIQYKYSFDSRIASQVERGTQLSIVKHQSSTPYLSSAASALPIIHETRLETKQSLIITQTSASLSASLCLTWLEPRYPVALGESVAVSSKETTGQQLSSAPSAYINIYILGGTTTTDKDETFENCRMIR
jgi:hypothetical protein